jgi:hypothetical protein
MNPNKGQFKQSKISDSQQLSQAIRSGWTGGYEKGTPAKYTSEEGFQEATPKFKGIKSKRIRQAFGRE